MASIHIFSIIEIHCGMALLHYTIEKEPFPQLKVPIGLLLFIANSGKEYIVIKATDTSRLIYIL